MTEAEIRQMLYDKGYEEHQLVPIRMNGKVIGIYAIDDVDEINSMIQPSNQYYTDDGTRMIKSLMEPAISGFSIRR